MLVAYMSLDTALRMTCGVSMTNNLTVSNLLINCSSEAHRFGSQEYAAEHCRGVSRNFFDCVFVKHVLENFVQCQLFFRTWLVIHNQEGRTSLEK